MDAPGKIRTPEPQLIGFVTDRISVQMTIFEFIRIARMGFRVHAPAKPLQPNP